MKTPVPELLAVDIGNSSMKFGRFVSLPQAGLPEPEWVAAFPTSQALSSEMFAALPSQLRWRVASVQRAGESRLAAWVKTHRPHDDYRCLTYRDLPLAIEIPQPECVGLDRLAAAVAVNALRTPTRAAVVIDAGSALTVDLLSPHGAFLGGTILPGFRMSAQVLASAADLLPLALLETAAEPPPVPGTSTAAAIRAGLFWGAVGAVREIISRYAREYPQPQVFVTGGDLERLATLVGEETQFVPNLVLSGIALAS